MIALTNLGVQRRIRGAPAGPQGPTVPTVVATGSKSIVGLIYIAPLSTAFGGVLQAGDMLIAVFETANGALSGATGWTELSASPQGTGTAGAADATRLTAYYHIWDGVTDPANTITGTGLDHQINNMVAIRGVDPVTPINAIAGAVDTNEDTSIEWPSVTTTVDKCLVLLMEAHALPDINTNGQTSGHTNANLTNIVEVLDLNTSHNNGGGCSVVVGTMATAGVVGVSTATASTATKKGVITLALAPKT